MEGHDGIVDWRGLGALGLAQIESLAREETLLAAGGIGDDIKILAGAVFRTSAFVVSAPEKAFRALSRASDFRPRPCVVDGV